MDSLDFHSREYLDFNSLDSLEFDSREYMDFNSRESVDFYGLESLKWVVSLAGALSLNMVTLNS